MNLVEMLKGPLTSGDNLGKLGGMLGVDAASAQKAVNGGIPALLSALAGSASSSDGMQKMLGALGKADAGMLGKIGGMFGGGGGSLIEQGSGMLGSLLGGGTLSGIIAALAKYSGVSMEQIKKLLGMLAPLIMGGIASQMKGKAPSAEGLSSFFSEQKANIAGALPSGLSLDGIPGLANIGASAKQFAGNAADAATGGSKLLLPLAVLLLAALGIWYFYLRPKAEDKSNQPPISSKVLKIPETPQLTKNLTEVYSTLTDTLATVKDAATADAALPALKDVDGHLGSMKDMWDKIPDAGKAAMKTVTGDSLSKLKDLIAKVLAIPGIGDKLKPVLDGIVTKLTTFGA